MSSPYDMLVVGTDGSDTAERAVRNAAALALELGTGMTIATAWYRDMPDPVPSEVSNYPTETPSAMEANWAEMTVSDAAGIARQAGVKECDVATPEGHPADALLKVVSRHPNALLVVGTAGLGSRTERLLGNVPHQITHHAANDVLLVRSDPERRAPYERVALATDGSDTAARAVGRGYEFVAALDAQAVLLTVAKDEGTGQRILDEAVAALPDGAEYERRVAVGRDIADTLSEAAQDHDLLVIGNKGMSGPSRLLGSVANAVTHRVPTDLLLVNTARNT